MIRSGELAVRCDIDFAAQSPWIFNGTVEENILFNRDLDKDRLDGVIRSCYLIKVLASSFKCLPFGFFQVQKAINSIISSASNTIICRI